MLTLSPKCPVCNNTSFKLAEPFGGIAGATFKMPFVTCSACNAAIAVLSQEDPGVAAKKALEEVRALSAKVDRLGQGLSQISSQVGNVANDVRRLER